MMASANYSRTILSRRVWRRSVHQIVRLFQRCDAASLVSINVAWAEIPLSTRVNTTLSTKADDTVDFRQHRANRGFTICKQRTRDLQISVTQYPTIVYVRPARQIQQSSLRANPVWHTACFTFPASTLIKVTS